MNSTNSTTGEQPLAPAGSQVPGMAIFWILLPLCLSCVAHPLATSIVDPTKYRRYLHVSPLFCFMDACWLFCQLANLRAAHPLSFSYSIRIVVKYRLHSLLDIDESLENSNETQVTLSPLFAKALLDIRFRLVADLINILMYVKICGFTGIRAWSSVADVFFLSWFLMEAFLLFGEYYPSNDGNHEGYYPVLDEMRMMEPKTVTFPNSIVFVEACVPLYLHLHTWQPWSHVEALVPKSIGWLLEKTHLVEPLEPLLESSGVLFLPSLVIFIILCTIIGLFIAGVSTATVIPLIAPGPLYIATALSLRYLLGYLSQISRLISKEAVGVVWARILISILCFLYVAYFIWGFDSDGTWKASWTEILGRKLRFMNA